MKHYSKIKFTSLFTLLLFMGITFSSFSECDSHKFCTSEIESNCHSESMQDSSHDGDMASMHHEKTDASNKYAKTVQTCSCQTPVFSFNTEVDYRFKYGNNYSKVILQFINNKSNLKLTSTSILESSQDRDIKAIEPPIYTSIQSFRI